ncbi:carbonyl reductase [NADPH] 1-like isoform X2 [Saccostrea echinata]|uniref:carbonyl reductase [NADPH] 1-like isoform X1 n=1 Tax=Saccostrea echinata TaxID=191078 RepID=UPI002A7FF260|nr:carbonyl reductase [NADPH] 1-like isoform X1 [Saccostrea echinata]XP_061163533.1 carbonyl reductase [NADPH] 1-like isoform X2 [Saccostrea echinata]
MSKKVAVVTGSNKGIGYAIVRGLCKKFDGDVYLTARNEELGKQAVKSLNSEGLSPKFHQLDISDQASINRLRDFLKATYGGLDLLVNNAGIAYKESSTAPLAEQAEVTIKTNYFGTLAVCEALFPILRTQARVVNVSSMVGTFTIKKCSKEIRAKFANSKLTIDELTTLMNDFVQAAKNGSHESKGYATSAYGMSKIGVSALSEIQHRQLSADPREDIIVNACCPGYVDTDMTSHKGHKTIDQGADTPLYLALLPPGTKSPAGNFVSEREIKNWSE